MTTATISDKEMDLVIEKYQRLDALRSCPGASDGEKRNASEAIDHLLRKHGISAEEMEAKVSGTGQASDFFVGNDEPHMAKFKTAVLNQVAKANKCRVLRYHDNKGAVLIGSRYRVGETTALYKHILTTLDAEAETAWEKRTVKFSDGADAKKRDWQFSFREGALASIKERLENRQDEKFVPDESEVPDMTDAQMDDYMRTVVPDIDRIMEEFAKTLGARFKGGCEKEADADDAPQYNPLGFYAGREAGKAMQLQASVKA